MLTTTYSESPTDWVVVRLSALGDLALITGVLDFWYRTRGFRFTVITRAGLEPILENHPAVKAVVVLEKQDLAFPAVLGRFRTLADQYRGIGLLDLHGTLRTRFLSLLWKGPVRRYRKFGLERRLFLRSQGRLFRERLKQFNVTQRYALALERVAPPREALLPRIFLSGTEEEAGRSALRDAVGENVAFVPTQAPVALHPYATHPDKAWKEQYWHELAASLDAHCIPYFVVGRGGSLPGLSASRDFTNRTSLRETCALLKASSLLVTGDSGPMHLACAVGTPVLALFGPTTEEWGFFPTGAQDRVLETPLACRPCTLHGKKHCDRDHACMYAITPAQVLAAVLAGRVADTSCSDRTER